MDLPAELSFLEEIFRDPSERFRQAEWLLSSFDQNIWIYDFNYKSGPRSIDWNVSLDDGSLLTEKTNKSLLDSLKYWLIASCDRSIDANKQTSNTYLSASSLSIAFRSTLKLIDYFLVHSYEFSLSKHGLGAINGDDLKTLLTKIKSNKQISEGVFNWSGRLKDFIFTQIDTIKPNDIDNICREHPELVDVDPSLKDNDLGIAINDIPKARAAMVLKGLMRDKRRGAKQDSVILKAGEYALNTKKVASLLYPNSLYFQYQGKNGCEIFDITVDAISYSRELPAVPVTTKKGALLTTSNYLTYRRSLYKIGFLNKIGLPCPPTDEVMAIGNFLPELPPSKPGRYRTVPSQIVFDAVKDAIEFHLKYGRELIDSYCRILSSSHQNDRRIPSLSREEILSCISPKLQDLGVNSLGLSCPTIGQVHAAQRKPSRSEYYKKLRANEGLLDLIQVYYGAIRIVIGCLSARRQGELSDLIANECLDESEQWLVFENRKSTKGLMGLRETEARPIEPVAVDMIKTIIKLQSKFISLGYLNGYTKLIAPPSLIGGRFLCDGTRINYPVNMFCDYFEVATNSNGERYYICQHQLRRFFAMLFFYSSSFGGLETLQWMLGHTDINHVWHYITESLDGSTLRSAKSQFAAESLHRKGAEQYKALSELVASQFNTNEFSIIDSNELEDYINMLLEDGKITIEPEFFIDHNNETFRIIIKVSEDS